MRFSVNSTNSVEMSLSCAFLTRCGVTRKNSTKKNSFLIRINVYYRQIQNKDEVYPHTHDASLGFERYDHDLKFTYRTKKNSDNNLRFIPTQ